jgi:esterase/lipase
MKNTRPRIILVLLIVFVLLAISGPKVEIDVSWSEPSVPEEIDAWLAESESRVPNLRPELQKQVIWADSNHSKTPFSVVYIHGFSSSRFETTPFSDSVAAAFGANLFYTRLRGHGQDGKALGEAKAQEWIQDTVEAIRIGEAIGEKVILIGTSTGATLVAWAALQPELTSNWAGQVWISPNFGPADSKSDMLLWPWGRSLMKIVIGDSRSYEPQNELHRISNTNEYGTDVLLQMMALVDVVRTSDFSSITIPTFMVYSPSDKVVDQNISVGLYEEISSARKDSVVVLNALDTHNHVIVGDALGPENTMRVARRAISFLKLVR